MLNRQIHPKLSGILKSQGGLKAIANSLKPTKLGRQEDRMFCIGDFSLFQKKDLLCYTKSGALVAEPIIMWKCGNRKRQTNFLLLIQKRGLLNTIMGMLRSRLCKNYLAKLSLKNSMMRSGHI